MTHRSSLALAAILALTIATPALAENPPPDTIFNHNYLTVAVGAAYGPSYDGSNNYEVLAVPAVMGRIGGVSIAPRPAGIALDLIHDPAHSKISFQLGPVVRARFDRNSRIDDPVVQLLGKRDIAVEVGANAGFSINRITNGYDSLTFAVDVTRDVAGAYAGWVISPNVNFLTPVSKGAAISVNAHANHVDSKYANYYYSISPSDSAISGLPVYTARSGWKDAGISAIGTIDLDGNLANGGFALIAGVSYTRMLGNIERAPIVSIRGSADQFIGGVGVAYTF